MDQEQDYDFGKEVRGKIGELGGVKLDKAYVKLTELNAIIQGGCACKKTECKMLNNAQIVAIMNTINETDNPVARSKHVILVLEMNGIDMDIFKDYEL